MLRLNPPIYHSPRRQARPVAYLLTQVAINAARFTAIMVLSTNPDRTLFNASTTTHRAS